jgi:hypothetical protein
MLIHTTWAKLANERERLLCAQCMFRRAIERQVPLTLADLQPCPFNLFHTPQSWFDLFLSRETEPPPNIDEWRDAMAIVV